jgi:hypothetical protein
MILHRLVLLTVAASFALAPPAYAKTKKPKNRVQMETFNIRGYLVDDSNQAVTTHREVEFCYELFYDGQTPNDPPSAQACPRVQVNEQGRFSAEFQVPAQRRAPLGARFKVKLPGSDRTFDGMALAQDVYFKIPRNPAAPERDSKVSGRGEPPARPDPGSPAPARESRGLAGAAGGP